jgi:hypothetical protein
MDFQEVKILTYNEANTDCFLPTGAFFSLTVVSLIGNSLIDGGLLGKGLGSTEDETDCCFGGLGNGRDVRPCFCAGDKSFTDLLDFGDEGG